jgi:hypothetical protein
MPEYNKGMLSFRFRHPTQDGHFEVKVDSKDDAVDAVFLTVDAVEKILMPVYRDKPGVAAELRLRVEQQQQGGVCVVLHKYSCRSAVPPIDWKTRSAKLGPADWFPPRND